MSQGNGKGGAKRRKSKRGGAGGDHSGVSSARECPEAEPCGAQAAAMVAPVATEAACVSECVGGAAAAGGHPEASDLGETQSSPPGSTVDSCVLCRAERRDSSFLESGIEAARRLGLSMAPTGGSAPPQPLWVCLHCQWTLEKLRIYGGLDQSAQGQDFLARGPLTAVLPAPPCSGTQGLDTQPPPSDMPRALEICDEPEEISIETDRDSQQLQNYWSELRYVVRCIYRQAGIPLVPEKEWAKELVDRLCMSDPSQLYQRLDQQARDYLLEMKIGLLRQLSAPCRVGGPTCLQSPMQAYQFIALLLKEYSTLCRAARTISTFLATLEDKHLNVFQVTWELHNKHLFENLVFSEPLLQSHLPALVSQLRVGATMHDSCSREVYSALLHRFLHLEEELRRVARQWLECQKRVSVYINEKMTMKNKLTKDLRQLTDRQSQEEELTDRRAGTGDALTDAMRHVLSSPICTPRCTHSRVMGPPSPINPHVHQLPFQVGSTPDSLSESHLPSVSLTSLVSGSGAPITTQQHPRLLGTGSVSTPTLCSEDDVASLSAKFADMYPSNDNTEAASSTRSDALGDPASLFLGRSILNLPASYSPDHEGQGCKKGTSDPQQEGRDKSADKDNCSEHGSATSTSSCACACTCTYAGQKEGKYCDYCCEFFRHNWLSSAPRGRNYEDMREKLRFRLAKRKEEQSKKTDEVSEQESAGASASASVSAVDHRPVEDLLQFINSSEAKPASSTRAAKRARHKQKKLEEKARHEAEASAREQAHLLKEQRQQEQRQREQAAEQLTEEFQQLQKQPAVRRKERPGKDSPRTAAPGGNLRAETRYVPDSAQVRSGSLEQTEEPKTSSDSPSRQAADTGLGAHGDSKLVLPKEVSGKQQEPLPFLLHGKHPHKEGTGKQKPKQAWKASSEPRKGPAECPRPSEGQPSPQPQTEPKAKVAGLTSPPEQKRKEKKANRNNNNRKQPSQGKEGKASPGATEPTGPSEETPSSKPMRADAPEPSGKSKKNKKKKGDGDRDGDGDGDGDDSSLEDIFMPKDIDLESVDMDETEREVESFKRFCLESARQTRPRLSIDWSNFSLKKPPFRP